MHYTNYATPQLQFHYVTTAAALHHTTSSSCGWGDHCKPCNHSNKNKSNHPSVNQWIRSAIRDSQQPTSPIGFLFWNFRHRLVRYYSYIPWHFFENTSTTSMNFLTNIELAGKKRCFELHPVLPLNPSVPSLPEQSLQLRKMKRPEAQVVSGRGGIWLHLLPGSPQCPIGSMYAKNLVTVTINIPQFC